MYPYFIKTPWVIKKIFSEYVWDIKGSREVFLTFDDGPHPEITPWVLSELDKYNAKASFFCLGKMWFNTRLYTSKFWKKDMLWVTILTTT